MTSGALILPDEAHAPTLSAEQAQTLVAEHWGLAGASATELGSYQDQVFRIDGPGGERFALKVANSEISRATLEMEHAALHHVHGQLGPLTVPQPVAAEDGAELVQIGGHLARLLTWTGGAPLADAGFLDPVSAAALGDAAGRLAAALASFTHPASERVLQWDVRHAAAVADVVRPQLTDREWAQQQEALALLATIDASALPMQVATTDVTSNNVLGDLGTDGQFTASAIVDFGDIVTTWRLAETVGAAHAAAFGDPPRALELALAALVAFHARSPLAAAELDAFWPVMVARSALCFASAAWQERGGPRSSQTATEYTQHFLTREAATLDVILAIDPALATAAARAACGLAPAPAMEAAVTTLAAADRVPLIDGLTPGALHPVAIEAATPALVAGAWDDPAGVAAAIATQAAGHTAVGRWGEERLVGAGLPSWDPAGTLHLGVDVFTPAGTAVQSPVAARVRSVGSGVVELEPTELGDAPLVLRLAGLAPSVSAGATLPAGAPVGTVAVPAPSALLPAHVHVQLAAVPGLPGTGSAEHRDAWLAVSPDPSFLLGIEGAAPVRASASAQRERRDGVVARAQELYYREPAEMVRGWKQYLFDASGRPYLDMVNNVAAVGHSHPAVAAAAAEQFQLLNTNSRFLYDAIAEYAEAITATLPPELSSVFFVNSGSEALDLAIRIARVATGRKDLLAVRGAYHGWTSAVMEACTHPYDNPSWEQTIPAWIHPVAQPNPFRGELGSEAGPYVDSVREQLAAAQARGGVAGFIAEPMLGNAGAVSPPAGYLAEAYALVRAAGGLNIADEVQVGYGRTGETFWSFEYEGVVPDIVAAAKSVGNGHPLGFVACRPELAEHFSSNAAFFSSPGGGPVSCRIGLAVLRAIQQEGLRENAATVGRSLKAQLTALMDEHELIAGVNGRGLYLGVDLARDRDTMEPASEESYAICERLRRYGVILQPTGEHSNVLKIKPPLCFSEADADYVVRALDHVLRERATSL